MSIIPSSSMVVWSAIFAVFIYGLVLLIKYYLAYQKRLQCILKLPGRTRHWLWGNIHEFPGPNEVGLKWMVERAHENPPGIGVMWIGPFFSTVDIYKTNTVKTLLKTSEPKPRIAGSYRMIKPWLGDGLLLSRGKKWERNRRLLTPAFHFDILKPYMEVNNRCVDIFLNKIEDYIEKNEYFEVVSNISYLTLDVMLRCAFSYDNDCQVKGTNHKYVQAVNFLAESVVYRTIRPWLYPEWIFKLTSVGRKFREHCEFVHGVTSEIIKHRKEILTTEEQEILKNKRYLDFLDILLTAKDEDGNGLSEQEIRDEADTFLFEGHDTTSSGISWTLYSLASHPNYQRKCQEEIDEILKDKSNKDIEWEDLPKLKLLSHVIKESLRLHTPVPTIQRETTQDIDIDNHHVPAKSVINIHLYVLHHMEDIWVNPEEFIPERFDPESSLYNKDQFAFVPFSAGPRNCIGQNFALHEMKTVIAKILSRYTLTLHPEKKVRHKLTVVMKTEDGMFMKAERRHV